VPVQPCVVSGVDENEGTNSVFTGANSADVTPLLGTTGWMCSPQAMADITSRVSGLGCSDSWRLDPDFRVVDHAARTAVTGWLCVHQNGVWRASNRGPDDLAARGPSCHSLVACEQHPLDWS
jgi:hypothetical protein